MGISKDFLSLRVVKHWEKIPRDMEFAFLEMFKSRFDKCLSEMVQARLI